MKLRASFCIAVGCCALAGAQEESVRITRADTLQIKVLEAPDLQENARVTDAGTISLILGGDVKVAGLTPAEAARVIEQALIRGRYVLNPHASVVLDQSSIHGVSVLGQVRNPGNYVTGTSRPILDVLALAGGLTDLANRKITVQRHDTREKFSYFVPNDLRASGDETVLVFPGDVVDVPKADVVYLLGDFLRPGGYAMTTNTSQLTTLQVVALAGGTPPNAVPTHTRLIRRQPDGSHTMVEINLSQMQKGKIPDFPLQTDDVLYLPFSYVRNAFVNVGGLLASAGSAAIYRF